MNRLRMCRTLLVAFSLLCVSVALAAPPERQEAVAATPTAEQLIDKLKPQHPRLLIDQNGFADLRRRIKIDPTLRKWDEQVRQEADKLLAAPLPRHVMPDGLRLLPVSRSVLERTYTLGLMYRLHDDRRYADRLWREMEAVVAFPDFNPRHFLDTAEMTHALAIAYDWLYDTWSNAQRTAIRQAIVRHGLIPGRDVYRAGGGWPTASINWNQVCNGGMTMGALAIGDEEPKLAGEILHAAVASMPAGMRGYAPDGAWAEGPGYWAYATAYSVYMLAALESALGSDYGLSGAQGFAGTGLYPLYLTGPTGIAFNFSDSHDRIPPPAGLFWLARRFQEPVYALLAAGGDKPTAAGMLWYRRLEQKRGPADLPLDRYWQPVEVVTMRSRWNDPQAIFAGLKAGSNAISHSHLDLGSFVLDALGQRWAVDLGGDTYALSGYFGDQRYDYYRLRAEGHNTLLINPDRTGGQPLQAVAKIRRYRSNPKFALAVADLTPAYARQAKRVERGLAMIQRRSVLVEDEVVARHAEVWWFMHTPARIQLSADACAATLSQGNVALVAHILAPADARFEVRAASPLSASPHPAGQSANEGIRKLAIHFRDVNDLRLAVWFTPIDGKRPADSAPRLVPLADWCTTKIGEYEPPTNTAKETKAADAPTQKESSKDFRHWSDATGKFHIDAAFRGQTGANVTLEKKDGSTLTISIFKLSDEDREWIKTHRE